MRYIISNEKVKWYDLKWFALQNNYKLTIWDDWHYPREIVTEVYLPDVQQIKRWMQENYPGVKSGNTVKREMLHKALKNIAAMERGEIEE